MTDTENGPDASGSWQPDPTGRYRLRWQRGTGEWTGHVYSSEGELANDPYDRHQRRLHPRPVTRRPTPWVHRNLRRVAVRSSSLRSA